MKNILTLFFLTALVACFLNPSEAQTTRELRGESNRPARVASNTTSRSNQISGRSAPIRDFNRSNSSSRTFQAPSRNITTQSPARNLSSRNNAVSVSRNRTNTPERESVYRNNYNAYSRQNSAVRNSYRYTNYRYNNYHNYNHYYGNHYYGNIYGRRTYFMYGPRYTSIPHSFISIYFGGHPYYYNRGYFYGYYSGYYQPIFPPFGLQIGELPFGYTRIFIGAFPFYYYNGVYYRQYDNNTYEVVDAPMGATVSALPQGAKSVIVNGEKLYELNGTYYKGDRDSNGNDVFVVVGKNGVINNTDEQSEMMTTPQSLELGDLINQLPEGSKIVTINGEQMYETPDNIYLEEEHVNGSVTYKVVGK
jgi:hypothetical protein